MSKITLINTGKAPTWESWQELKNRKIPGKARLTMTQQEALAIFQKVLAAPSVDDAAQSLKTTMPSRKVFTYWLGQIGHRQNVRLGKGKGFSGYVKAVVESILNMERDPEVLLERNGEEEMAKKDTRPAVIVRKGSKSQSVSGEASTPTKEMSVPVEEESGNPAVKEATDAAFTGLERVQGSENQDMRPTDTAQPEKPAISRVQLYALRNLLVFADCAVQVDQDGIFHVLARNFEDKGLLNFWLSKVGLGNLSTYIRNKDLIDSFRILSREIHKDMKRTVGQPRARKNLKKHGSLAPVGLAYLPDGRTETFTFRWQTLEEKRRLQGQFQMKLLAMNAVAAVIISETWARFADDGPLDLTDQRSVRDMPGRRDAILIEAGSPLGRVVIVQTFAKIGPRKLKFDRPREFTTAMGDFSSQFLDMVWPVPQGTTQTWN